MTKINFEVEARANAITEKVVPFWIRSNQNGSIPLPGITSSFTTRAQRSYGTHSSSRMLQWGFGFEGRLNVGAKKELNIIEAQAKASLFAFQVQVGRTKGTMGLLADTSLSTGSFSVSGNALGIPKIEVSIPEYYVIPALGNIFSIKGTFSHGWYGQAAITDTIRATPPNLYRYATLDNSPTSYLHQKSFYVRIGKGNWKLHFSGGFNHQVIWGNEKKIFGDRYTLSFLETLKHVTLGQSYGSGTTIPNSKIGNQLGSIDFGMHYKVGNYLLTLTRQNFYDVGALYYLANVRDGLNSFSIRKVEGHHTTFYWKRALLELMYSKHQAGEFGSKATPSGDEDYYNNYFYGHGWSYNRNGIGTPLITPKSLARNELSSSNEYFINNRVRAFHFAVELGLDRWDIISKLTYSNNFGTFATSPEGHTTGKIRSKPSRMFGQKNQFSAYLLLKKRWSGTVIGLEGGLDQGELLYNSGGFSVSITKKLRQ